VSGNRQAKSDDLITNPSDGSAFRAKIRIQQYLPFKSDGCAGLIVIM
jgi:hypothetical protein